MVVRLVLLQETIQILRYVRSENEGIVIRIKLLAMLSDELSLVDEVDVVVQLVEAVSDQDVAMDEDTVVMESSRQVKNVMYMV